MKILVISDIHIDACDKFGTFQWKETEFIMYLEEIRNKYKIDQVILNGDIFELVKYGFNEITMAKPMLVGYLLKSDYILIKGNHDIISKFGVDHYDIVNSSGQTIHIEHGHKADFLNGTHIGRAIGILGFWILRKMSNSKFLMDLYFSIVVFEDQVNRVPKKYNRMKYLTYALKLLQKYDIIILGHTHKLESHHTYFLNKKKRYLNSGSCSLGRFQGVFLDTETLKYELIKENKESLKSLYKMSMVM